MNVTASNAGFMAKRLADNPWWVNYPADDVAEEEKISARLFVDGYVAMLIFGRNQPRRRRKKRRLNRAANHTTL